VTCSMSCSSSRASPKSSLAPPSSSLTSFDEMKQSLLKHLFLFWSVRRKNVEGTVRRSSFPFFLSSFFFFFCQSAKRETSSSRRSWTCWSLLSDRAVEAICRLRDCRPSILSSTVSLITNRVTETALVWPIRWTLSIACSSTIHQRNFTVGLRCCCCF